MTSKDHCLSISSVSKAMILIVIFLIVIVQYSDFEQYKPSNNEFQQYNKIEKPRVEAIVFAGRKDRIEILDLYLRRNLVRNGGVLSSVQFMIRTDNQNDIEYVQQLVNSTEDYRSKKIQVILGYSPELYNSVNEDTIYVKIDDDIVFIRDGAIETIVDELLTNSNKWATVSANIINHPLLGYINKAAGALHPYVLDTRVAGEIDKDENIGWRVLHQSHVKKKNIEISSPLISQEGRVRRLIYNDEFNGNPIEKLEYDSFGYTWRSWEAAANSHYSFFHNFEEKKLERYDFGLWNFNSATYNRWSINFFAIFGKSILQYPMPSDMWDDEIWFGQILPEKLNKHSVAVGNAVVAHFSYEVQNEALEKTDVLAKYKALANEIM